MEAALFLLDEKDLDSDNRKDPMMVSRTLGEMVSNYVHITLCSNLLILRLTLMMKTMGCYGAIGQVMIAIMLMGQTQQHGVGVKLY